MRMMLGLLALGATAACAPVPAPTPPAADDYCRARDYQHLIGANVAAVSFPAGANVRVVCTTCPMTRDYRRDRLNVLFDEPTGIIREVRCG